MFKLRNSSLTRMNPWLLLGGSLACLIGTHMCDYKEQYALKNLMYGSFIGTMSLSMAPMISMYGSAVMFDSLIATGVTMGALSSVAMMAPSEQFLNWGAPLACGLGGLMGVSLLSMVFPQNAALTSIWLYGGLGLFSAFTLYDIQKIMHRAKT